MGDIRFMGTEQRKRAGAESSHMSMIASGDRAKGSHPYANGDPIGGGWGPHDVPCATCGGEADDSRHLFSTGGN